MNNSDQNDGRYLENTLMPKNGLTQDQLLNMLAAAREKAGQALREAAAAFNDVKEAAALRDIKEVSDAHRDGKGNARFMHPARFEFAHSMARQAELRAFSLNETNERAGLLTLEEQVNWMARPATRDQEVETFRFETLRERERANRRGKLKKLIKFQTDVARFRALE